MLFLLNETRINGIKSIDKEIVLSHTNKGVNAEDFTKCHIKAIYGSNGAGKSGIVHAYDIYKFVINNEYPFRDPLFKESLVKLINKKTKELSISLSFSVNSNGGAIVRLNHSITIANDGTGLPFLKKEKLDEIDSRGDVKSNIFEINSGEFKSNVIPDSYVFERSAPFLRQNSCILSASDEANKNEAVFPSFVYTLAFANFLQISFGSSEDDHNAFDLSTLLSKKWVNEVKNGSPFPLLAKKAPMILFKATGENCLWVVPTSEERRYKDIQPKLEMFLKLLKPSIKAVDFHFKHDGVYSYCNPVFDYGDYSVDYEFESTGVKKLCHLFLALYSASRQSIVIIDEIDAGIHDVFFEKLIEYFLTCPDCQIVMTTHNIGVMESLKKLRKSIDVLTDDCEIVSWVSKGQSSPSLFYSRGALGGVPLNLQSFDFSRIFEIESDQDKGK